MPNTCTTIDYTNRLEIQAAEYKTRIKNYLARIRMVKGS